MPILGILASSQPLAAGDYESIATVTVGSGGAADVQFTSIGTDWTHLQIRGIARLTGNNGFTEDTMRCQFNSDTGNNYAWHQIKGDGTSATATAATSIGYLAIGQPSTNLANSNVFGAIITDILDYRNTNKNTTVRTLLGMDNNGADSNIMLRSGVWLNTAAVTSIKLYPAVGNFAQHSHFALYGIKSA